MGSISVTNLGKAYKQYPNRWSRLVEWLTPGKAKRHHLKWILQGINFTVNPGEAVGIIGMNGAGKSTLLKMITGTTQPTTGNIHISGRVAAMLELGMGFHPDFTGRQNARMACQLLGLSEEQIESKLFEIESFADIGEYFDQSIRIYSSGMQARVAFAVATSTEPDILIVDEALSVGDIAFQAKCMQRMNNLVLDGVTVLLVSHSLNLIRQFCNKTLYISGGKVRAWGASDEICDLYQNDLVGATAIKEQQVQEVKNFNIPNLDIHRDPSLRKNSIDGATGGSLELEFLNFRIYDVSGNKITSCRFDDELIIKATILCNKDTPAGAAVGLLFADKTGYHIMACNTNYYNKYLPSMTSGDIISVEWRFRNPFASGEFRIDSGIKPDPFSHEFYDRVFCLATLSVVPDTELLKKNFGGYLFTNAEINFHKYDSVKIL
jgi:lipopolysaccharide transport system ATP-binding protein